MSSMTVGQAPKTIPNQTFEVSRDNNSFIYFRKGVLWHDCHFSVKMDAKITKYQLNTEVNIGYGNSTKVDNKSLLKDLNACIPESATETGSLDSFFSSLAKKAADVAKNHISKIDDGHAQSSVVPEEKGWSNRMHDYFMIKA